MRQIASQYHIKFVKYMLNFLSKEIIKNKTITMEDIELTKNIYKI